MVVTLYLYAISTWSCNGTYTQLLLYRRLCNDLSQPMEANGGAFSHEIIWERCYCIPIRPGVECSGRVLYPRRKGDSRYLCGAACGQVVAAAFSADFALFSALGRARGSILVEGDRVLAKKLYVGNLGYGVKSSDLETMFSAFGTVQSAQVIEDRDTGRSKGFAFVEMGSEQEAQAAIQGLNGQEHDGRAFDGQRGPAAPRNAAGAAGADAVGVAAATAAEAAEEEAAADATRVAVSSAATTRLGAGRSRPDKGRENPKRRNRQRNAG